jgi:hypothetical protein
MRNEELKNRPFVGHLLNSSTSSKKKFKMSSKKRKATTTVRPKNTERKKKGKHKTSGETQKNEIKKKVTQRQINVFSIRKESAHPDDKRPYAEIVTKFFKTERDALKWCNLDFCNDVCDILGGCEEEDVPPTPEFIEWYKNEKVNDSNYMSNQAIEYRLYNLREITACIPDPATGELKADGVVVDLEKFSESVRLDLLDWIKVNNCEMEEREKCRCELSWEKVNKD